MRRLGLALMTLVAVVVVVSTLLFWVPVDPVLMTFGQRSDDISVAAKRLELGVEESILDRVVAYLWDVLPLSYDEGVVSVDQSHLGYSYQSGAAVVDLLSVAVPNTLLLGFTAFLVAVLIGVPFGIIASLNRGRSIDTIILSLSTVGISVPSYVSSIVLALVFGFMLHAYTGLPIQGSIVALDDLGNSYVAYAHLILPCLALGIRPIALITQLVRSTMIDVLSGDYVRTALSKGVSSSSIVWSHALPNGLNPIITALTGWLASMLAGTFFVERVFSFRGVGDLTISALLQYDIPVVLGCILFVCSVFILVTLLADILYVVTDPTAKLR